MVDVVKTLDRLGNWFENRLTRGDDPWYDPVTDVWVRRIDNFLYIGYGHPVVLWVFPKTTEEHEAIRNYREAQNG